MKLASVLDSVIAFVNLLDIQLLHLYRQTSPKTKYVKQKIDPFDKSFINKSSNEGYEIVIEGGVHLDAIDFKQIRVFPFAGCTEIRLTKDNYIWFTQNNLDGVIPYRLLGYVPKEYEYLFKRARNETPKIGYVGEAIGKNKVNRRESNVMTWFTPEI